MSPPKQTRTEAPELWLNPEQYTDYGFRQGGWVVHGDAVTPITFRRPEAESNSLIVLANGWTGDKNSMRTPAIEAVYAGHMAVTVGYTNLGKENALEKNAADITAVTDVFSEDLEKHLMGLSMGGWVVLKAMEHTRQPVQSATLVASAGFTSRIPTRTEVVQHMGAEIPELATQYIKDPVRAGKVAFAATKHIMRRRVAIGAEIAELTSGSAHTLIESLQASGRMPFTRFIFGANDKLIPAHEQQAGIQGVLFDQVFKYKGGHVEVVFNPALSREIFELDLPNLAEPALAEAA